MTSKFKGFLRRKNVGTILDVENHSNLFYKDFSRFISNINPNNDDDVNKLNRFLDLLRYAQVYIDDKGKIVDKRYEGLLNWIIALGISKGIDEKIRKFNRDISHLESIKSLINWDKNSNYYFNCFNSCNSLIFERFNATTYSPKLSVEIEEIIDVSSLCMRNILLENKKVDINRLNDYKTFQNDILNRIQYFEIVKMWKYANAEISENNEGIFVDCANDISKAFVTTRDLNQENRDLRSYIYKDLKSDNLINKKSDAELIGLGEEFFLGLDESDSKKVERFLKLKNYVLYDISLEDWIGILLSLKEAAVRRAKQSQYFLPLDDLVKSMNNISRIQLVARVLSFKNDFLDTPFLISNGVIYAYIPSLIICDPIHLVHIAIKYCEDKRLVRLRGKNFEKTIGRMLESSQYNYCKAEYDKSSGKEIKIQYSNYKHEYDLMAEDDNDDIAVIECKTFMDPFSYRDYRIEMDKMYVNNSEGYLINDSRHFIDLKKGGYKILKQNVQKGRNLYSNVSLRNFMNKHDNWNTSYSVFISNMFFPKDLVAEWQIKYNFYFIHWFEFNRVIKRRPLNTDCGYCNGQLAQSSSINEKINGFNKRTLKRISNIQLLSLLHERRSEYESEHEYIPNKLIKHKKEVLPNGILSYYE